MIHKDGEITSTLSVLCCAKSTLYFSLAADSDYPRISCQISPSWYCSTHPMTQHMLLPWAPITSFLKQNLSNLWTCRFQFGELQAAYLTCLLNISPEWPWCLPTQNLCLLGECKDVTLDVKLICFLQKTDSPSRGKDMTVGKFVAAGISQACNCHAEKFQRFTSASDIWCLCLTPCLLYPDHLHFLIMQMPRVCF